MNLFVGEKSKNFYLWFIHSSFLSLILDCYKMYILWKPLLKYERKFIIPIREYFFLIKNFFNPNLFWGSFDINYVLKVQIYKLFSTEIGKRIELALNVNLW